MGIVPFFSGTVPLKKKSEMSAKNQHHKLVILGSGTAGLTAAIYAARANLNPVVVSGRQAGGQLMITTDVENYPGFPEGIKGPEMMDLLKAQAARFDTEFYNGDVIDADLSQRPFKLTLETNKPLTCDSLIISTGASARSTYVARNLLETAYVDILFDYYT